MLDTKLIYIEGLPGSGKSTAALVAGEAAAIHRSESRPFPGTPARASPQCRWGQPPAGETPGDVFFQNYNPENFIQESFERWQRFLDAAIQDDAIYVLDSYPY